MQHDSVHFSRSILHERDLCVHDLEEEIGFRLGEKLDLSLPGCLAEKRVAFSCDSESE